MAGFDLDSIKARADKARPGPWELQVIGTGIRGSLPYVFVIDESGMPMFERHVGGSLDDSEFVAQAREDVPLLAAAIERAIFELDRIPEYAYTGHTPTCQGEPGCPLCRALAVLRGQEAV